MTEQQAPDPIAGLRTQLPPVDQDFLRKAAAIPNERAARYTLAEQYYLGDHHVELTDRAKQFLEASGRPYVENFCGTVVNALAERLRVTGITSDDDAFAAFVWDVLWDRNRLDARMGPILTETLKKGDGFLIVNFDAAAGRPTITFNKPDRCQLHYDDGEKVWAAKSWDTAAKGPLNPNGRTLVRLNVYWPDRIEKWFRLSSDEVGVWSEWVDEGDVSWPVDWTDAAGEPLGIPVFHLANQAGVDKWGWPEHWGNLPQQDRLTKELIDLSLILDTMGAPQRWAKNVANAGSLRSVPGEVWSTENGEAEFGQFEAADPAGALASIEATLQRISALSRTPSHMIIVSGDAPSGESQKTAEAGLVAKADDRKPAFGEEIIGAIRMMATLAAIYGEGAMRPSLDPDQIAEVRLNVQWADSRTRNEKEHAEYLLLLRELGVSRKTLLGMVPGIDAQTELEQAEADEEAAATQLLAALDSGGMSMAPGQGRPPGMTPGRPLAGAAATTAAQFGKPPVVGA